MDSQTNKYLFNIFFLILTFFSIQLFNNFSYEENFNKQQITSSLNISDSISYEQINYSDDLEVDTSFDLQKRKIFDIDIVNINNTSNVFISLLKTEEIIRLNTRFSTKLYKLSNSRGPPLS
jgi:hypothetical protein